jgi:hypothetical protein
MPFSVLDRSPHVPDTATDAAKLALIIASIAVVTYLISNIWLSASTTTIGVIGYLFDAHLYIPIAVLLAVSLTLIHRLRTLDATGTLSGEFGASIRDLALIGGGFFLYEFGRTQTQGSESTAVENAERVLRLQNWLHLPNEANFQAWFLPHTDILEVFNKAYSFMFLSTFIGVFLWMSFNAPAVYRTMRNAVGVATFGALAFFALVPLAPPRLTDASGMVDSHARVGLVHGFVNQYAAMPSLHVGWMALAGWGLAKAIGGWKGRLIGVIPPTAMMITVVVTGNHYWLDGIVGSILCLTPAILFDRLSTKPVPRPAIPTIVVPVPEQRDRVPRPAMYITLPAVSGGDHTEHPEPVGHRTQ